uniref:Transcriptional regulator n=1 Tax=Heterorhabditis bacteriophora TaxID=37862 RepID=A0A1I7WUH6_HETBA
MISGKNDREEYDSTRDETLEKVCYRTRVFLSV